MPTIDLPLVVTTEDKDAITGDSHAWTSEQGAHMKNMVVEEDQSGRYAVTRTSLTQYGTSSGNTQAFEYLPIGTSYNYYVVHQNTLYKGSFITDGISSMTSVGTVGADTTYHRASIINTDNDNLFIKTFDRAYVYDGTTLTQVSDADYPSYTGLNVVELHGYVFVLDVGDSSGNGDPAIYNSSLGAPSTWVATDYVTPDNVVDHGIGIAKHHDHIVYFGEKSIEFFYDAGNPTGSPLTKRKDISYNIGIDFEHDAQGMPFVEHEDKIYFVGKSPDTETYGLYVLDNFRVVPIKNKMLEKLLRADNQFYLSILTFNSKSFLCIFDDKGQGNKSSILVDLKLGVVSELEFNTSYIGVVDGVSGAFVNNSGLFYVYSDITDEYQDKTVATGGASTNRDLDWIITTPVFDGEDTFNKFLDSLEVVGEYRTSGTISVSWTDDDYENFSTARTLDISQRSKLTRCGKFNRRAFRLSGSSADRRAFKKLQLSYREGGV